MHNNEGRKQANVHAAADCEQKGDAGVKILLNDTWLSFQVVLFA